MGDIFMKSGRLEAFVDAVVAIIITVLMLELPRPKGYTLSSIVDLRMNYFAYVVTFLLLSVFWVNHHKIYQHVEKINDTNLWINIAMLFVLSFAPYLTEWMDLYPNQFLPVFSYWLFFLLIDILFFSMMWSLIRANPNSVPLASTVYSKRTFFTILGILVVSLVSGIFVSNIIMLIGCFFTAVVWVYGVTKI